MSILLEALRKSEKNQHPHEVPTIHSDDQSGPVSESLKIGPLALLLIVALFTSGWFVWRQYQAPTGIYQPPVTLAVDKSRVAADPVKKQQAEFEDLLDKLTNQEFDDAMTKLSARLDIAQ